MPLTFSHNLLILHPYSHVSLPLLPSLHYASMVYAHMVYVHVYRCAREKTWELLFLPSLTPETSLIPHTRLSLDLFSHKFFLPLRTQLLLQGTVNPSTTQDE